VAADTRRMRNIGDFTGSKQENEYTRALEKLMRDLKTAGVGK